MRVLLLAIVFAMVAPALAAEDDDDFEETAERTPCWPSQAMLIKRANEDCPGYARRVCAEAKRKSELADCSMDKCVAETEKRCPFRDLIRSRANNFIKAIAKAGNIWDEQDATKFCTTWYGKEISNVTRMGAVWDALYMLPCPHQESAIRKMTDCYKIETSNIRPSHPDAQFCYTSYPIDLGIGQAVSTQCCYGSDLRLLVLGHKGAGSVDFVSKLSQHSNSESDHFENDLFPSLACCALSDNCVKFSAMRPPSVRPETDEEAQASCHIMSTKYEWKPYGKYEPPYARDAMIKSWKELHLDGSSLVPTPKLSEILRTAQKVRDAIHRDHKNPYDTPTHPPIEKPSEKPEHKEEEEETTASKPTEKPLVPPEKPEHDSEETHHEANEHQEDEHKSNSNNNNEEEAHSSSSHHVTAEPKEHEPENVEPEKSHHSSSGNNGEAHSSSSSSNQQPSEHENQENLHHGDDTSHHQESQQHNGGQQDGSHRNGDGQHKEESHQGNGDHKKRQEPQKASSKGKSANSKNGPPSFAKDFGTKKTDRDLDAAIEAVLKGQTKKPDSTSGTKTEAGASAGKQEEKSADSSKSSKQTASRSIDHRERRHGDHKSRRERREERQDEQDRRGSRREDRDERRRRHRNGGHS